MITVFTAPKPYSDNIAIIQRNALQSWTLLNPRPEIILIGDEIGISGTAGELGVRHEPDVAYNEWHTPLVSSLFYRGQQLATHDVMMYINADIILLDDFMPALDDLLRKFGSCPNFLGIGERWDIDIAEPLDFSEGWEAQLRADVESRGVRHGPTGVDYFLFQRGAYTNVPPFALGRWAWDNWLVSSALQQAFPVINMTNRVLAVHQNHGYKHEFPQELCDNQNMMGDVPAMHAQHATYIL